MGMMGSLPCRMGRVPQAVNAGRTGRRYNPYVSYRSHRAALLCLGFTLAACQGRGWAIAARDAEGWLLSVTELGEGALAVGGRPGRPGAPGRGVLTLLSGDPPAVARRVDSPVPGMLWWVHAQDGRVAWAVGEGGTVLRYEAGAVTAVTAGTTATLYGVWAFSDDEVWAVGGDDGQPGVVLRGGRQGLAVDGSAPRTGALFKIYGAAPGLLYAVGAGGVVLRRQGGAWIKDAPLIPGNERLFGVHGVGDAVYAVGGVGQGRVVAYRAGAGELLATSGLSALTGVWVAPGGAVLVAGQGGLLAGRPAGGAAFAVEAPGVTDQDLHAVHGAGARRYAVGGNLSLFGLRPPEGVLLHRAE